jgi:hypothetical protein
MELIEENLYLLYLILALIYFSKTSYAEFLPKQLKELVGTYTNEIIVAVYIIIAYNNYSKL